MFTDYSTLPWTWCSATIYGPSPNGQQSLAPTSTMYGATWNCQHTFTRIVRGTVRVIREILDEMQADQPYDMDSNVIMAYADELNPQLWRSSCPLIIYAIVEMHHPVQVVHQFGMMQNVPESTDTRDEPPSDFP
ncbi:UNVERIFIED_CONTAM: hypothetical protein Sindi_0103400 [Sesamum indicum]